MCHSRVNSWSRFYITYYLHNFLILLLFVSFNRLVRRRVRSCSMIISVLLGWLLCRIELIALTLSLWMSKSRSTTWVLSLVVILWLSASLIILSLLLTLLFLNLFSSRFSLLWISTLTSLSEMRCLSYRLLIKPLSLILLLLVHKIRIVGLSRTSTWPIFIKILTRETWHHV